MLGQVRYTFNFYLLQQIVSNLNSLVPVRIILSASKSPHFDCIADNSFQIKINLISRLQETSLSTECNIDENVRRPLRSGNVEDTDVNNIEDNNAGDGNIEDEDKYEEVVCDCTNCQAKHPCLLEPNPTHDYTYEY